MKIVVDIPKETYEALVINQYCGSKSNLENIIVNGIPLPEHHGDLIDRDNIEVLRLGNLTRQYDKGFDAGVTCMVNRILDAPTVIEGSDSE